jgi:uncharacterized protein YxeA
MTMSEENAWRKKEDIIGIVVLVITFTYFWHNACTGEDRDYVREDFEINLKALTSFICP